MLDTTSVRVWDELKKALVVASAFDNPTTDRIAVTRVFMTVMVFDSTKVFWKTGAKRGSASSEPKKEPGDT